MADTLSEDAAAKVLRQVEFYFSDSNLINDRFLKQRVSEREDGMVDLALICSFERMKKHLSLKDVEKDDIPENTISAAVQVLRKSTFLKVSEDGKMVGRATKIEDLDAVKEEVDSRTVAVSPLPYDAILENVEKFFSQYGKVNSVRLPKHVVTKKAFSGIALIEFSTLEECQSIYNMNLEYEGAELKFKPKKEHDSERRAFFEESVKDGDDDKMDQDSPSADEEEDDGYTKGLILSFTLTKADVPKQEEKGAPEEEKSEDNVAKTEAENNGTGETDKEAVPAEAKETNVNTAEKEASSAEPADASVDADADKNITSERPKKGNDIGHDDIKQVLNQYGIVRYVEHNRGDKSGFVRFDRVDTAQKARTAAVLAEDGGLKVKDHILTLEVVEGKAEKEYWARVRESQGRKRESGGNYRGRGRRGRGGRHNNKRGHYSDNKHGRGGGGWAKNERPNKFQKKT